MLPWLADTFGAVYLNSISAATQIPTPRSFEGDFDDANPTPAFQIVKTLFVIAQLAHWLCARILYTGKSILIL
jgi:hypothetical protein